MDDRAFVTGLLACIAVFGVTYLHQRKYCDDPMKPNLYLLAMLISVILMIYSIVLASFNPSTVNVLVSIVAGIVSIGAGYMHFANKQDGILFKA